jgi:hypothetical protein
MIKHCNFFNLLDHDTLLTGLNKMDNDVVLFGKGTDNHSPLIPTTDSFMEKPACSLTNFLGQWQCHYDDQFSVRSGN